MSFPLSMGLILLMFFFLIYQNEFTKKKKKKKSFPSSKGLVKPLVNFFKIY